MGRAPDQRFGDWAVVCGFTIPQWWVTGDTVYVSAPAKSEKRSRGRKCLIKEKTAKGSLKRKREEKHGEQKGESSSHVVFSELFLLPPPVSPLLTLTCRNVLPVRGEERGPTLMVVLFPSLPPSPEEAYGFSRAFMFYQFVCRSSCSGFNVQLAAWPLSHKFL